MHDRHSEDMMHNNPDEEALIRAEENRRFRTGHPFGVSHLKMEPTDLPGPVFEWNATCNQLPKDTGPVLGSWIDGHGNPLYVVTRFAPNVAAEYVWYIRRSDNMDLFDVIRPEPYHWAYIPRPEGGRYR